MNNFMKKAIVTLTVVLMALSMVVGASAASTSGGSCTGNIGSTNVYSVYSSANTSGNVQGIDVNSLLSDLSSYGCPTTSINAANSTAAVENSTATAEAAKTNCTTASCEESACKTSNCGIEVTCTTSDCTTSNCATNAACATNACTSTGNQSAVLSANSTSTCTANSTLVDRINSVLAKCGTDIKKLCIIRSGTTGTTATPTPVPSSSVTPTPSATPTQSADSGNSSTVDNQSFEQQVVTLVNEQRAANGLAPLTLSTQLSNAARAKSQDMHDNNYFSHTSPTYGSPFDMLKSFGISYRTAGENIAMGYATPQAVVNAWMNSAGHRANILNASYTQIGVGYVADGNYWTQEFIG